jgi:1,4-alpha-glucan branching enzyme
MERRRLARLEPARLPAARGVQNLIRDLNALYRKTRRCTKSISSRPASNGFRPTTRTTRSSPSCAGPRSFARDALRLQLHAGRTPRLPDRRAGPGTYHERLNTDSQYYGGSNVGNPFGMVDAEDSGAWPRLVGALTLPPLATVVFFEWEA